LRVATWNVRHGRPHRGFTSNARLQQGVAALDADVVAVQEVEQRVIRSWFADQPALIATAAGATSSYYAPARRLAITGSDGIALCVRGTASYRTVDLPHRWGQRRVAIVATAVVDGTVLTIVTTHLQNQSDEARQELQWLIGEVENVDGPCVVLGDLNLRPEDVAAPLVSAGFVLAGGGFTSPADRPVQQIDHIAVRGLPIGDAVVGDAPVSDHRPLLADIG